VNSIVFLVFAGLLGLCGLLLLLRRQSRKD
jgi:LPXTG-motif cell wall-anchored protein